MASPDIHLKRWHDESGHPKRCVTRLTHRNECVFGDPIADMDVVNALVCNRRFPFDIAPVGPVIVTHEKASAKRKRFEDFTRRTKQHARIAAGKICARRTAIWHEQRVADKRCITNHMGIASWRMARRVHHEGRHQTDFISVAVDKQPVELAAVAPEFRAFVEDFAKDLLDRLDVLAYPELATELPLNVGRRRKMISVSMGLISHSRVKPLVRI